VNVVPFQPLQARICEMIAPPGPNFALLMYRVPSRQASPATNGGESGNRVAVPPASTKTPPGVEGGLPPSPSNTRPAPNANEVGVVTPEAKISTVRPPAAAGSWVPAVDP